MRATPAKAEIPRLSFKSALLVLTIAFATLFGVPFALEGAPVLVQWLVLMISSLLIGATIAYAHCFVETKKRLGQTFWLLLGVTSTLVFIIEFFLFGLGIYL